MDPILSAALVGVLLFALLGSGLWIFAALAVTAAVALAVFAGFPATRVGAVMEPAFIKAVTSWELAAVPLFLWMGELINRSDLSRRLFNGLTPWVQRLPGGLLHSNIAGCVLFSAVSGSSVATTATIGQITTKALRERNYDRRLSVGSVAAAGSIGIMIPPSLTMIIYGVLTETSVARLFAAGMVPGLLLGLFYAAYICFRAKQDPKLAPRELMDHVWRERLRRLPDLLPIFFLIAMVLGGIYSGLATPSEAAALGVGGTLLTMVLTGQSRPQLLLSTAMAAARTSAMLGTAFAAAAALSTALGLIHAPQAVAEWIASLGLSPLGLILLIAGVYVLLGCVLESVAMILMTMPITFPLIVAAGFDPIWFGVFIVLVVEMGLITPPIGFNLFVMRGISGEPIAEIARGALPFFLIMIATAGILIAFPDLALWLPRTLFD